MARLFLSALLLLPNLTIHALACLPPHLYKRWFSVGNSSEGEPTTVNAWPVVPDSKPAYDLDEDGLQLLRYCWTDQASYNSLNTLLEATIDKWQIATSQSNLRIVLAAGGDPPICGQAGVAIDSLYITDIASSKDQENSAGYTTPGYNAIARDKNLAGRHVLNFRRSGDDDKDAIILAHELGHAIGFDHEFARPDAADYIFFYPENLIDYEEVKAKIKAPDTSKNDQFGQIGQWAWSIGFDYDSIMMHDSYSGGNGRDPVLMAHAPGTTDSKKGKRWTVDMGFCGEISSGDIARVQQLYPLQAGYDEDHQAKQAEWQGTSMPILGRRQAPATTTSTFAAACTPKHTTVDT